MDEALAVWLGLREAADWKARSAELAGEVAAGLPATRPIRVLDLATGTGSNLRYLMRRLPSVQEWLLVDRSPDLLRLSGERTTAWAATVGLTLQFTVDGFSVDGPGVGCRVRTRTVDLNLPLDPSLFTGCHLVTASALLDLVSDAWIGELAERCRSAGAAVLCALTYDGRSMFVPREPDDDFVRDALNEHQHRDKGLGGAAAGPDAHAAALLGFERAGFTCRTAVTDWTIGPGEQALQGQLIEGLAFAAAEQHPAEAVRVAAWRERRLAHLAAGRSRATVGHRDLAARLNTR